MSNDDELLPADEPECKHDPECDRCPDCGMEDCLHEVGKRKDGSTFPLCPAEALLCPDW